MIFARLAAPLQLTALLVTALLVSATDEWAVDGALWRLLQLAAILLAAIYLLVHFLLSRGLLERKADTDLLERICRTIRLPAMAAILLFVTMTIDPHVSTIASPARQASYPVQRVPCAGSGLRPTVPVKDGKICLRRNDGESDAPGQPASIERVDLNLVSGTIAVGAAGWMFVQEVNEGLLTRARYLRPIALRPA